MTNPSPLRMNNLTKAGSEEASATGPTASPARGAEMRDFLKARLQKNRAPPLVHSWEFWHDRQDRGQQEEKAETQSAYEDRLVKLSEIDDVRSFWAVFNNFSVDDLGIRQSVHLFHKGVKPLWEDPRNVKGGSWTFRVRKAQAADFWKELCMMAIGEQLQAAVEDTEKATFRDDICGVSLSVRFNSLLIQVWNRDGENSAGINRMLKTILEKLPASLKPEEERCYYKKHSEHGGFSSREAKS